MAITAIKTQYRRRTGLVFVGRLPSISRRADAILDACLQ
jgi:hypothetical protein